MTVYLLIEVVPSGTYECSDWTRVVGAFSSRSNAEEFIEHIPENKRNNSEFEIEERLIDPDVSLAEFIMDAWW